MSRKMIGVGKRRQLTPGPESRGFIGGVVIQNEQI